MPNYKRQKYQITLHQENIYSRQMIRNKTNSYFTDNAICLNIKSTLTHDTIIFSTMIIQEIIAAVFTTL